MKKGWLTVVAVMAAAYVQVPAGSFAGDALGAPPAADAKPAVPGDDPSRAPAAPSSVPEKAAEKKARQAKEKVSPARRKRDLEFKKASEEFPRFCKRWEENLRERERDNLKKLAFALVDGLHTATFTGYGEVKSCEAHQSKDGYSIGKIVYEEFTYSLSGKTPEEAARAEKTPITNTITTEIFRWEKNKWFY
jgi:hypothetical protein